MNYGISGISAAILVLASVLPAAADVTTVTCADFLAMDAVSKKATASEMLAWLDATENSAKEPELTGKYMTHAEGDAWTPENFVIEVEGHCIDSDPAMTVFARLGEHT